MFQIQGAVTVGPAEPDASELSEVEVRFAGQISMAVWFGQVTDEAAREALRAYAIACHPHRRCDSVKLHKALAQEYHDCRERQDLVS